MTYSYISVHNNEKKFKQECPSWRSIAAVNAITEHDLKEKVYLNLPMLRSQSTNEGSQGKKSRQDLGGRNRQKAMEGSRAMALLTYLPKAAWVHLPTEGITRSGLGPPTLITN